MMLGRESVGRGGRRRRKAEMATVLGEKGRSAYEWREEGE